MSKSKPVRVDFRNADCRPPDLDTASSDGESDSAEVKEAPAASAALQEADVVTRLLSLLKLKGRSGGLFTTSAPVSDASDEESSARASVLLNSEMAHIWLQSAASSLEGAHLANTQIGMHRALFQDLADAQNPRKHVTDTLKALQTGRLSAQARQGAWTGKRLKSGKAADVGRSMQMSILDGAGYIPGLQLTKEDADVDDDESGSSAFSSDDELEDASSQVTQQTNGSHKDPPLRMWTILMMGGGHFAAAVIALNPHVKTSRSKRLGVTEEKGLIVLAHRTFHRYTTRKKQGGGQSSHDAAGKFAKSAGAQLRRYGEESLKEDIKSLLDLPGWRTLIERSERVWVRAGARAAKGVLWAWDGRIASPLDSARQDGRLANVPIQSGRATLSELLRCFFEIARARVAHHTEAELVAMQEARVAANQRNVQRAEQRKAAQEARQAKLALKADEAQARAKEVLTPQEKSERDRFERLVDMIAKGKVELVANFFEKYGLGVLENAEGDTTIDSALPTWWRKQQADSAEHSRAPIPGSLLQLASEHGDASMVHFFLVERKADPTRPVPPPPGAGQDAPRPHRTAYDLASTKAARDVFRRMMAEQPDWWDWGGMAAGGARVPSALTEDMADAKAAKVKDRRAALREKARARASASNEGSSTPKEEEEVPVEPVPEAPSNTSRNRLGGNESSQRVFKGLLQDSSMTPEMKARIEREKRARAAEERMKALQ